PGHGVEPGRGDPGRGRLRAALGRAEADRREALEDLQRPAAALVGPARGTGRDRPARGAGRLVDHAREGEPRDPGGREPDRVRGDRQRRDGQLQLNAFEPIIAHSLFKSIGHLAHGIDALRERCVTGIAANRERMARMVEQSIGIATALNPYIGYGAASDVAREALATGKTVYELVLEKKLLPKERLDEILEPEALTRPGFVAPARVKKTDL